ncbi:MAG: hypothetical protein KC550_06365, partial [Nanoarchaeota archaeon]|nr:hypothetical protein [Nanoarchaeota archaeon]
MHKPTPVKKHERILVFDVETTTDTFQNIKVGYFELYYENKIMKGFILEEKNNRKKENNIVH